MIVGPFHFSPCATSTTFEAEIRSQIAINTSFTVKFVIRAPVVRPSNEGDAWLAATLLPAMFAGEDLEIHAPVSSTLLHQVHEIQQILRCWYPDMLHNIAIKAQVAPSASSPEENTGLSAAFFSGGVDSWYTLQKHQSVLSSLITVKGFDVPYADTSVWPDIVNANTHSAQQLSLDLITVETDLRDKLDPSYGTFRTPCLVDFWGLAMHGAGLAAIGLLPQEHFRRIFIASSWAYIRLQPWGSHPLVDRLWSNDRLQFIHDGCEAGRMERLRAIAKLDIALQNLRVCPAAVPDVYNCGQCEKCQRTMLALKAIGALDRAKSFEGKVDYSKLERLILPKHLHSLYREILHAAESGGDLDLQRLLRIMLGDRVSLAREWHRLRSGLLNTRKAALNPVLRRWKRSLRKRLPL